MEHLSIKNVVIESLNPKPVVRCDVFINAFTTFIDNSSDTRKVSAQIAVLQAYQRLNVHGVQTWIFTTSDFWAQKALEHGVLAVRKFDTNAHGTPFLGYMYEYVRNTTELNCDGGQAQLVFDFYANGDIIFTRDLVNTLSQIRSNWKDQIRQGRRNGVLVVGKRTNVDYHQQCITSDEDVEQLVKQGKIFQSNAQDYFIYSRNNSQSWKNLPRFVVGRRAYDNWLVNHAYHDDGMDLIDATNTITALHLTATDGNHAGHNKGPDNNYNVQAWNPVTKRVVNSQEWDHSNTHDSHYFTKYNGTDVQIVANARQTVRMS